MPRPNLSAYCPACGTLGRPLKRTVPFCSSRCRINAAHRGIFLAEDLVRLNAKTVRDGECLIFQGDLNHAGYGTFYIGIYSIRAHVFAWIKKHGPVPEGREIGHSCHRRACIEERHLSPVTHLANMEHSARDGRMASGDRNAMHARPEIRPRGVRSGRVKLTDAAVIEIRALYQKGKRGQGGTADLARRFGVCAQTIRDVMASDTWTHI